MAMALRREEASTSNSTETVTVSCNIPMGAILYLEQEFEVPEAVVGGGTRISKQFRKVGEPVYIKGTKNRAAGDDPDSPISDGYMLTFGVPKDFMDAWWAQNKDWAPVKNGMIRYASNRADMKSMTKENTGMRTGLEPMNPKGDPRSKMLRVFQSDVK